MNRPRRLLTKLQLPRHNLKKKFAVLVIRVLPVHLDLLETMVETEGTEDTDHRDEREKMDGFYRRPVSNRSRALFA